MSAGRNSTQKIQALQGSAANTVLGHGFPAGLLAVFSSVKGLRVHARSLFRSSEIVCTRLSVKNAQARKGVFRAA